MASRVCNRCNIATYCSEEVSYIVYDKFVFLESELVYLRLLPTVKPVIQNSERRLLALFHMQHVEYTISILF
jgi:hypothetical protein